MGLSDLYLDPELTNDARMHRPKRWNLAPVDPAAQDLASRLKTSPLVAQILLNRGVTDPIDCQNFLRPNLKLLHDPFAIPSQYWNRYDEAAIEMPRVRIAVENLDPHSRRLRHVCGMDLQPITDEQIRAARRAYFGAVSYVDDQIGSVLQALAAAQLSPQTIVLVLADHGEMLGERGLWYKMSFFEPACRIPLLVHAPRQFTPGTVAQSVSLIDLLPTLLELAGDGKPPQYATELDGRSLLPHLGRSGGHDEVLGEYLAEGAIAPIVMIRRGRDKFIHCAADPDQLYDLCEDPDELRNLAVDRGAADPFRKEVLRIWALESLHAQVIASQRRRLLVAAALRSGRQSAWDYQPQFDASQQYVRNDKTLDELEAAARFPRSAPAPREP